MSAQLEVRNMSVSYAGKAALRGADLSVRAGEVLAVLGPSGSGKSTLLRSIAGLEQPTSGTVEVGGADVTRLPTHKRSMALMFQDGQLFKHLTVADNVGYAFRVRRRIGSRLTAAERTKVGDLLELVGLATYADRLPATLSGGEQQRVALARSLAINPSLLLLDEPLSALDRTLRERLADDLRRIIKGAETTTIVVTHDHQEAFAMADRIALMRSGDIIQRGTLSEVWAAPVDAEAALFLGYARVFRDAPAALLARTAGMPDSPVLAARRSALQLHADGALEGEVRSAQALPEQTRLVVDVPGLGAVDAVAPLGQVEVGARVRLRADRTRMAPVGGHPPSNG